MVNSDLQEDKESLEYLKAENKRLEATSKYLLEKLKTHSRRRNEILKFLKEEIKNLSRVHTGVLFNEKNTVGEVSRNSFLEGLVSAFMHVEAMIEAPENEPINSRLCESFENML